MISVEVLPWSSIYATFGSAGVDGHPLIFEVISDIDRRRCSLGGLAIIN
jgi:hypothetical protein